MTATAMEAAVFHLQVRDRSRVNLHNADGETYDPRNLRGQYRDIPFHARGRAAANRMLREANEGRLIEKGYPPSQYKFKLRREGTQ